MSEDKIIDKRKVKSEANRKINICVCVERRHIEQARKFGLNLSLIMNDALAKIFDKEKVA